MEGKISTQNDGHFFTFLRIDNVQYERKYDVLTVEKNLSPNYSKVGVIMLLK